MKLNVFIVFCSFCFVQVYSRPKVDIKKFEQDLRDGINGVSERFIGDFSLIVEKFEDAYFVLEPLSGMAEDLIEEIPKNERSSKIDVDAVKKFKSDNEKRQMESGKSYEDILSVSIDFTILLRRIISKELSPEQYIGITNLFYALTYPKATTEEIESALGYLYGTGNTELKDLIIDLPTPNATDCPQAYKRYSVSNDKLKSLTDIKPEFLRNFAAIIEKFPCNDEFGIPDFLEYFVKIVDRLKTLVSIDKSKISACYIKKESDIINGLNCSLMPNANHICLSTSVEREEKKLKNIESILSERLANEDFRELINFVKATVFDKTPLNEVQKSLEYVFIDAVSTDC